MAQSRLVGLGFERPLRGALAWLLVALGATTLACSSDHGRRGDGSGGGAPVIPVGPEDRPSNGSLRVNEAELTGEIAGTTLQLRIPVEATGQERASGTLSVRLLSVDGTEEIARTTAPYDVQADSAVLEAELTAPAIDAQANLVDFIVRIEEADSGDTDDTGPREAVRVSRSLLHVIPLYELEVRGPKTLREARDAIYRVRAQEPTTRRPIAGIDVELSIEQDGKRRTEIVTTDESGDGTVTFSGLSAGSAKLIGDARAHGASITVSDTVTVDANRPKLLLTTDKPLYQPGQTIHLRALGLERESNRPLADELVTFEVEDAKGNKVFKKEIETDAFGVAATEFVIGQIVNQGHYKVRVLQDEGKTEKTVEVTRYALPKFAIAINTEKPWYRPGEVITGAIDARYFFGKTVTGAVTVEGLSLDVGQTLFQSIMGQLDTDGHYTFSLQLPPTLAGLGVGNGNALVSVRATVTDAAGQKLTKEIALPVSSGPARLSLVPEATEIVPGIENTLLLFVTDPLGAPLADAALSVSTPEGTELSGRSDAFGQAEVAWAAPASTNGGVFQVTARVGKEDVTQSVNLGRQRGAEHLLVRTDKAVYEQGEEVSVEILTSNPSASVYVDWLNDGQTVDVRTLEVEDGRARFTMPVDTALLGDNRVEAYVVDSGGDVVRAGRTVFARSNKSLGVELETDKSVYAPGESAKLTFKVTDETGEPAVAALGVQIVDEAVYGLVDAQPGLLRTYFELDDAFATPQYEIHGPSADLSRLFFVDTLATDAKSQRAAQRTSAGALAALGTRPRMGIRATSYPALVTALASRLSTPYQKLGQSLSSDFQKAFDGALAALKARGCTPQASQCGSSNFQQQLNLELENRFSAFDFWGQALRIQSAPIYGGSATLATNGPDEIQASADDAFVTVSFKGVSIPNPASGPGVFPSAGAAGAPSAAPGLPGGNVNAGPEPAPESPNDESSGGDAPRVRQDFPETLYVNPSVITDASGTATLDLTMADSITEWRVSSLASSTDGRLGGGEAGVTVFQDFFVDVAFPATLTRGDEVTFPIAVYNYLDEPQTVTLELEPASWYTALGATSTKVSLEAGEVKGVGVPVRVENVGLQSLQITASGSTRSDAVLRSVRVVSDGKRFVSAHSGALAEGSTTTTVEFPSEAISGSGELYADIYPAFMAQVVSGMDSMLQVPNGCFEQTTSTAWPNVLVTDYMRQTQQLTPEIQLKAESLMSAGYQRLLTFEHPGGGFSWFGTQDPKPYLSVTAFGLMEFSDMARVQTVDEAMVQRTIDWLVSQQMSDGSFAGDMSEFFSFHTSTVRNTAFVVWALASAGYEGDAVDRGLAYVKGELDGEQDAYTLGIVANAFALGDPSDPVLEDVLAELDAKKKVDGDAISWDTEGTQTNFYGGGKDGAVSTTALVAHALLSIGGHTELVNGALAYLAAAKDGQGNFGSTQATIWALRALTLATRRGTEAAVGTLQVFVDDELFRSLDLTEDRADVTTRIDMSSLVSAGDREVRLAFDGTGQVSYNVVSAHNLPWSAVPAEPTAPLGITLDYDKSTLYVNETVTAEVRVENTTNATQNMVLVTLGIPPGFDVLPEALEASLGARKLSRYEITGRQLILYVTELPPRAPLTISYQLQATMPVNASDGGAQARLYYEPEKQGTAQATSLIVNAQ